MIMRNKRSWVVELSENPTDVFESEDICPIPVIRASSGGSVPVALREGCGGGTEHQAKTDNTRIKPGQKPLNIIQGC